MTTITISPSKSASIEFDLSVQGSNDDNDISVRLVVLELFHDCNISIECSKSSGSKWKATFPAKIEFSKDSYDFRIEAVVNEYYFEPASGKLEVLSDPIVKMVEDAKPAVVANFNVEQVDESVIITQDEPEVVESTNFVEPVVETAIVQPVVRKPGKLFARGADGKPVISGLDSLEVANRKTENARKVQSILNQK